MEHLHGPQTQVREGAYAIKVSMRFSQRKKPLFILLWSMHGPYHVFSRLTNIVSEIFRVIAIYESHFLLSPPMHFGATLPDTCLVRQK